MTHPQSHTARTPPSRPGIALAPVFHIVGILIAMLGLAMLIPGIFEGLLGRGEWRAFIKAAAITIFIGVALVLTNRPAERPSLTLHQAFVVTALSWFAIACFAALPYVFADPALSVTDAFFEAMSGITTTGSTVIAGLDTADRDLLLWRSVTQWLGGIGIIVMGVAILPLLSVGGMQLFRAEHSDNTTDKILPNVRSFALALLVIYGTLTLLCALALLLAGMSAFDAANHAMTTIATGGYSTRDASIGAFENRAIELVVIFFMLCGGTTFMLYVKAARQGPRALAADPQLRLLLTFVLLTTLALALWQAAINDADPTSALVDSLFNVVSVITTTGYASTDYGLWGAFPVAVFFFITFVGACSGSTSGGLKMFRIAVLYAYGRVLLRRLTQPHGVFVPQYGDRAITEDVATSVLGFVFLYGLTFAVLAAGLSLFGLDLVTATSGAATAIANVGPGLGEIIGPAGNFSTLPDGAKWLLAFGMLLGRLEMLTVLVLLLPSFWRN